MELELTVEGDLHRIVTDLGRAPGKVVRRLSGVAHKAGINVRDDARRFSSGLAHAPLYPQSITYDLDLSAGAVAVEVGPDKDLPQGALGNLLEYGSVNNPPHHHLGPAFDREAPAWLQHVAEAGTESLW